MAHHSGLKVGERREGVGKPRALYQTITDDIEERILSGAWPPGHRIPFEHALAGQYGCSRMTVNKALTQLVNAGLIERRRKSGSYVRQPESQAAVLEIHGIREEVEALGLAYRFALLARRSRSPEGSDWRHLGLDAAGPLLELTCLHFAAARPFCLEERVINLDAVPDATGEGFTEQPPGSWLLSRVPWSEAEHRIQAVAADDRIAHLLEVEKGGPLLLIERCTWSGSAPITRVRLSYPAEGHTLVARFTPAQGG